MELHTNSSNNTIFADADGDIAYFHGNFIPKRDPKFDWTKPVDGSDPATDWQGPALGRRDAAPAQSGERLDLQQQQLAVVGGGADAARSRRTSRRTSRRARAESPRGFHALTRAAGQEGLHARRRSSRAAFDSYLPSFEKLIPPLLKAYDAAPASDPLKAKLAEQIALLRAWDYRWGVELGADVARRLLGRGRARRQSAATRRRRRRRRRGLRRRRAGASSCCRRSPRRRDKLAADFGTWKTPWGDINRFQRINDDIVQPFDDAGPSIPVAFASARWGSLASFGARAYPNTKKWYGTSGNSFVAVVEFGDSVRARAVTAGGESGDPSSKHFNDQATRYATRQPARGLLLPVAAQGAHRAPVPPGRVTVTRAAGTFDVKLTPQPTGIAGDAVGHFSIDKRFAGDLTGSGKGEMLSAGSPTKGSAGYVAMECVTGTLAGREGTFVLQHTATMHGGNSQLSIQVVPQSGTGGLAGLSGTFAIVIADGKHSYQFDYELADG